MSKKKKTNPRRIPRTQADVNRAKDQAAILGIRAAQVITFMGLLDGGFLTPDIMRDAWAAVEKKADSIEAGYCTLNDLRRTLREEYGINA